MIIYVRSEDKEKMKEMGLVPVRSNMPRFSAFVLNDNLSKYENREAVERSLLEHLDKSGIRYVTNNTLVL